LADGPGDVRPEDPPAPHRGRNSVLVVDNKDAADSLVDLLELMGFQARVAHDGPSAVRVAIEVLPDFVLCDLGLPGEMDGFAVARACRAEASLRSARFFAVSGYSSPQDHAQANAAGFERLLTKPVTRESLASIVGSPRP
jgi:CheY-like chemotaxis protein